MSILFSIDKIDISNPTFEELSTLPISETQINEILEYINQNGRLENIFDLIEDKRINLCVFIDANEKALQKCKENLEKFFENKDVDWEVKLAEYEHKDTTAGSQELACSGDTGCEIVDLISG